jgi:hypothetical protein
VCQDNPEVELQDSKEQMQEGSLIFAVTHHHLKGRTCVFAQGRHPGLPLHHGDSQRPCGSFHLPHEIAIGFLCATDSESSTFGVCQDNPEVELQDSKAQMQEVY